MIRTILSLGRTPLIRRIIAALILLSTAIGVSLFRNNGAVLAIDLGSSILVAIAAFGLLHLRWRKQEARGRERQKIKDTFL
ncbi:hypothetical protein [uncultured Erythrobacter sp.]|uniref:hypothetical protein n=1 Tax=uncultured Erythrobacter sp. TaxID=263913 RepID=UPI002622F17A|nr:hypothetical protein [uncultured Erythrobacter sp.]